MKDPIKIIGISPGTRYIGFAIFYGLELVDWGIKAIPGKWRQKKIKILLKIIEYLITRYEPNVLALKKIRAQNANENASKVSRIILSSARREKIISYSYDIKEIEKHFLKDDRHNRMNLFSFLVSQYPSLKVVLEKERNQKNPYYFRALEAVGVGYVRVK